MLYILFYFNLKIVRFFSRTLYIYMFVHLLIWIIKCTRCTVSTTKVYKMHGKYNKIHQNIRQC